MGALEPTAAPAPERARLGWLITCTAYPVLLLLGAALGLIGSFLVPTAPRILAGQLSYALLFVLVTNPVAAIIASRLVPHRLGAGVPLLGWLTVVLVLGTTRPEGDIVVPGDFHGTSFLILGALTGGVAVGLVRQRDQPRRRRRTSRATPEA